MTKGLLRRRHLKMKVIMASLETVKTGSRIETRVRGRVFRYAPDPAMPKSKERRGICVLNQHAGAMLYRWGVEQPCYGARCTHTHQSADAVAALVRDGVMKYLGWDHAVATYVYGRTWKGVSSGGPQGVKGMQLV